MAQYDTEEEQLEALKEWWKENGHSVIAGIVLGAAALFGWKYWQDYQVEKAENASAIYADVRAFDNAGEVENALKQVEVLTTDFAGVPYASLASLDAAQALVEAGDLDAAEAQLRWAVENAKLEAVGEVARLRLAQVLIAQGRAREALAELETELPAAYTGLVEELRGDAYRAQGDLQAAREAYDRALLSAGSRSEYLQLKRDDLGRAPAEGVSAS